jgi:hypothetical protein
MRTVHLPGVCDVFPEASAWIGRFGSKLRLRGDANWYINGCNRYANETADIAQRCRDVRRPRDAFGAVDAVGELVGQRFCPTVSSSPKTKSGVRRVPSVTRHVLEFWINALWPCGARS